MTASSITERYAFEPANPKPITYLTSTFLHADWWHVLGNMWFLWLAGFVLEDAWGRPLYLLVYLAAARWRASSMLGQVPEASCTQWEHREP